MPRYGIIDLGSNTIRLCIYEVNTSSKGPLQKRDIETLLNYKIMAGLASHVHDGVMTKKGIKRAISTINAHLKRASHFDCKQIDIFATAVLRNCKNSAEATKAIENGCAIKINMLSSTDEAHLGFVGAQLDTAMKNGVIIDIGGGSTELSRITNGKDSDKISIPQGSLSSYSEYTEGLLPTDEELGIIAGHFLGLFESKAQASYSTKQLYGIGGTIRSATKVWGDMFNEGERYNYLLPEHLDQILAAYQENPGTFAHKALQTIPDRIHTFIPGCIIIREVFKITGGQQLTIAKFGVREGYLAERILRYTL